MKTKEIWLFVGLGIIAALIVIRLAGGKPVAERDLRAVGASPSDKQDSGEVETLGGLNVDDQKQPEAMRNVKDNAGRIDFRSNSGVNQNKVQPKTLSVTSQQKQIRSIMKSAGNRGLSDKQVELVIDNAKSEVLGIRATAVTALGQSKSPAAIEPLIHALMDTNLKVRERAKVSLKNLLGVEMAYDPASSNAARQRAADRIMENVPSFRAALAAAHGG